MRLIDADELIQEIKPLKIILNGKSILSDDAKDTILRIIDEQPTAYDIGKVVGELEEHTHGYLSCYTGAIKEAIEIVKAGGKNV